MGNIFDQTRDLLKQLQSKATSVASNVGSFVQKYPTPASFVAPRVQQFAQQQVAPRIQSFTQNIPQPIKTGFQAGIPVLNSTVQNAVKGIATNFIYNPQTKTPFPQSPYWQTPKMYTPEGKINVKGMTDFSQILAVGMMGGGESKLKLFTPKQVELAKKSFTPEVRNMIGRFAELVESNPGANRANLGAVGDYMQSLGETVFGKQAANLTNRQLKNQFDLLMQQTGGNLPKVARIGLSTANVREGTSGTPSIPSISPTSNLDPVQKIIQALKASKPLEQKQGQIYSKIRSQQAGAIAGIGKNVPGEAGFHAQLGQLKGEMPKVQFESIRKQITQPDIDSLFNKVEQSVLSPFEKITAKSGLAKLLGAEGGSVPVKSELNLLNEVFPPEFIQAVMDKRPFIQRLWGTTEKFLNLPRAVMATLDLSAPLRQGVFLIGRPKQWVPAFKDMFKYAKNESSYKGLIQNIQARPTYQLMRQSKLAITDMSPMLGSREEAFMSNLAEKIPGFGVLAKASNRAYSGFLNKLRADTFDDLYKNAQKLGLDKERPEVIDDIAKFVNSATGRGKLPGAIDRAAVALNSAFFSPRLMASRFNLLNPQYYATLDPFVRKEALKSLFTFAGTAMSVMTLAKLGGADVGADPRSADFAKIKVGNTRYDILGGFQQYLRLAGQLITGQKINTQTGKLTTLGEGYGVPNRKDILLSFVESKAAPVASFALGLLQGKNAIGDKFNLPTELINRFIPMVVSDMYDIAKEAGSPLGAIPAIFGTGVQTYGKTEMVTGKNQIGEPTSQIRPVQGLGETITEKVFGQQPLDSSSTTNVKTYYEQLIKMPKEQAAQQFDQIIKTNPELAKKINQVIKDKKAGITVENEVLKAKGVANGDRAVEIAKEINKLKTKEEKATLWDDYVKKKIITKDVANQLKKLLAK